MANQAREKRGEDNEFEFDFELPRDIDFSELFELPEIDMNFSELDFELPEVDMNFPEPDFEFPEADMNFPEFDIDSLEFDIDLSELDIDLSAPDIDFSELLELPENIFKETYNDYKQ